ncbi:MAG: AzlD domain-containing protein [Desulfitobacteriaceae bacterium]|nr:AzlD domain-containing protein [Desulfitobacteriaceae bacterium]MDI6880857.1 AzlD domain-containing protein [Desulfitobacteriaceae bacterium]MDI6913385.1 AzlD domain-containing protein [Desulfitobacteriaceae bacterium]
MKSLALLVLGMGLVTYIPRMLPMVLLGKVNLHPFLSRFLQFIPFAALSALIVPGILSSTNSTTSAVAGGVAASILAFFRLNVMFVVLGGILGVFFWELWLTP